MVKKSTGYTLPSRQVSKSSVSETLAHLISELKVEASPGFVYSIYEDRQKNQQHIVFLCAQPTDNHQQRPADHAAQWYSLAQLGDFPITDPALESMMARFVRENAVGNYGLYYGDECHGLVKHFALQAG